MMYGYNGSGSWSGLWAVGMHFQMLFGMVLFCGLLCGAVWLFRFAKEAQVKKLMKWFLLLGILGSLIAAPFTFWGMENMMQQWRDSEAGSTSGSGYVRSDDDNYRGMMDWYFDQEKSADSTSTPSTTTDQTTAQ